ncbi:MAG: TadG family pilus assembly protein [Methylococcales bacterium]
MGALVLGLAIVFTALSIDTGRLTLEQRRLQKIADMAALDTSSHAGSCGEGSLASASLAAQASAVRNGYKGNLNGESNAVVLGNTDASGGVRTFLSSDPEAATAVQVTTRGTVPASLMAGGIFSDEVTLQARAVAERQALGGISAGSLLLSLNSKDSVILNRLLNGMLGSNIAFDAVSYQGIADAQVTLLDLVNASASAGTVNELLTTDMSAGELMQLYADAVNLSGTANAGVSALLSQLITVNIPNANLQLGEVIDLTTPDTEAAATANVNLLDLITTTALVANGNHAITLPLAVTLPAGLLSVQSALEVIEAPQIAIGPPGKDAGGNWRTQVNTAQIRLTTDIKSTVSLGGLLSAKVDLGINIQVAQGSAWLDSIQCRSLGNPTSVVKVGAQPGIASLSISKSNGSGAAGEIIVKTVLLGDVAKVTVGLNLPVEDPSSTDLVYIVNLDDPDSLPEVQRASSTLAGSLSNGLSDLADHLALNATLLKFINLGLNGILNSVVSGLLEPLITQLATATLDPLLRVLGIQIGSLDVQLFDVDESRPDLLI